MISDLTYAGARAFGFGAVIVLAANVYYLYLFHKSLPFRQWGLIGWANVVGLVLVAIGLGAIAVTVEI